MSILNYIEKMKEMYEGERIMNQEPRNMYQDGQLVAPSVDGSRPGYGGPSSGKFGQYTDEAMANISDAILKSYAEDDISLLFEKSKSNPTGLISAQDSKRGVFSMIKNDQGRLDYMVKNTGLDQETILNILDDRDAFFELEKTTTSQKTRYAKRDKFFNHAEKWLTTNAKRYADPKKFEKAFIRTFGKNNLITQTINANIMGPRDKGRIKGFSDDFVKTIMATAQGIDPTKTDVSFNSKQLKDMFKTVIYNNNPNVRKKITKIFENIVPAPGTKRTPDVRDLFANNATLKKYGLDKSIKGPIARLIFKEIGEDLFTNVKNFQKPFLGTDALLSFLKDRVDPKYKEMFREASNSVKLAQKNQWPAAKKSLNLSQDIMFDHKIPKSIIDLGYADEIEYIKLNPTSAEFNRTIKRSQFDQPMNNLIRKFEDAKPAKRSAIIEEMNTLKNKFSSKYGGYLDDVKINVDKTGKPIFSSKTPVVTKKTDLVKSLKTSLQQEKGIIPKNIQKLINNAKTAKGPGKIKALSALVAMVGAGVAYDLGFNPTEVQAAEAQAGETGVVDKVKSWPIEHPWLTGGAAVGATASTKAGRKLLGKLTGGAFGPTGMAGLWTGFGGVDVKDPWDRAGVAGEALLAPTIVKGTEAVTKGIKNTALRKLAERGLNLGMTLPMATRVARIASPIGLLSLAGEGIYHAGKKEMARRAQLSPEELADFHLERQSRGWSRMKKAGGGMVGIRKPHAIPPERQGLRSIMINVNDD